VQTLSQNQGIPSQMLGHTLSMPSHSDLFQVLEHAAESYDEHKMPALNLQLFPQKNKQPTIEATVGST
jgi:hypothetical protein